MRPYFCFIHNGEVTVRYNDVKYVYGTDAIHHPRWKKLLKYKPMAVWNEIQKGVLIFRDPPLPKKQLRFDF